VSGRDPGSHEPLLSRKIHIVGKTQRVPRLPKVEELEVDLERDHHWIEPETVRSQGVDQP
jgi:hypothetical protein